MTPDSDKQDDGAGTSVSAPLRWYTEDELLELAKDYAHLRGYKLDRWSWIKDSRGRTVCRGWRTFLAILFRWQIVDWVDWKERDEYGRWRWQRRYMLSLTLQVDG